MIISLYSTHTYTGVGYRKDRSMELVAAQAGYLAMRAQLAHEMSQMYGTETPDVLIEAYDRSLRALWEAEVYAKAAYGAAIRG